MSIPQGGADMYMRIAASSMDKWHMGLIKSFDWTILPR